MSTYLSSLSVVSLKATHVDQTGSPVRECHIIRLALGSAFVVFCDMRGRFFHTSLEDWNKFYTPAAARGK